MVIQMNGSKLATIEQIREFLAGTADVSFTTPADPTQVRAFIAMVLRRFKYADCSKAHRGLLFAYMQRLSAYSKAHLARLISLYKDTKTVALRRYERQADISVSHLYNLRGSDRYRHLRTAYALTKPTRTNIGIRKSPAPEGLPSYIRIDAVHQGELDGMKGVYHINAVDIVTQWQVVVCVQRISEAYLVPVIKLMLESFPFVIHGFHSDNGSEFINHEVAKLLNKLRIEFTKSRPRHSNDNALVECKNGVVIRKLMGYAHIPQERAKLVNLFFNNSMNPYLNFHRPCFFAVDTISAKGKVVKTYPQDQIMTPWDRLQSIDNWPALLKPDITVQALEQRAYEQTDSQAAEQLQKARKLLFQSLNKPNKLVA
jgi:Integrase core domain